MVWMVKVPVIDGSIVAGISVRLDYISFIAFKKIQDVLSTTGPSEIVSENRMFLCSTKNHPHVAVLTAFIFQVIGFLSVPGFIPVFCLQFFRIYL